MKKPSILFVCLGNICRSPSAEAVMKKMSMLEGKNYLIDSAGTSGWHAGEPADYRMQQHAIKRDYNLTSLSRPFDPINDFDHFDYIIGMDDENIYNLKKIARNSADLEKIYKMTDFAKDKSYHEVPDPYYGGAEGFETVLDILEDSCEGLMTFIEESN